MSSSQVPHLPSGTGVEHFRVGKDGSPEWYVPTPTKTRYDFPKAKEGESDRLEFAVGQRHPGKPRRLDRYLQERFPGYSRSFLQKMIKEERVLLNGKTTKASWHVTQGEQITMLLYPGSRKHEDEIAFEIVMEDEYIMAICKPAGVLVHPSRGHHRGTLWNGLLHYFKEKRGADPSFHIGTVHRLDEETSGIMVYALCKKANGELTRQFENRLVKKTYLCLAHGAADFETHEIEVPIGTDPENRLRCAINGVDARTAKTTFVRVGVSPCKQFSLLRAHPHTGRTHQIRVHAKALGHSLVGDALYDGLKEHEAFDGLSPRCCLHAESLFLHHPVSLRPLTLTAPVPADMREMIEKVGLGASLQ